MGNCTALKSQKSDPEKQSPSSAKEKQPAPNNQNNSHRAARPSFLVTSSHRSKTRLSIINIGEAEAKQGEIQTLKMKSREVSQIKSVFSSHYLFKNLPNEVIKQLISSMKTVLFKPNTLIFDTDCLGKYFFIIKKGKVEIVVDGKVNEVFELGKGFGEAALLQEGRRTSRARSVELTEVWALEKDHYKLAVKTLNLQMYSENKDFLRSLPMFHMLSENDLDALSEVLTLHSYNQCQVIVNEGEPGDFAYIIKKGKVGCYVNKEEKRQLGPGDFFGEQALLYDTRRTATVIALDQVEALSLGRKDLSKVLGGRLESIFYRNSLRMAFDKSAVLSQLLSHQIEDLIDVIEVFRYNPGETVVEKNTAKNSDIYIVLNGHLSGDSDYSIFSCIGDEELVKDSGDAYEQDIVASEGSVVGKLSIEKILTNLGDNFDSVIRNNKLIKVLKEVPLLKNLSIARFQVIVSLFKSKSFKKDETLFRQGEIGESFYIISKGSARVLIDGKELRIVGKNDFFGERSILMNNPRTATVIARESLKCWVLASQDFLTILDEPVRLNLIKRMELQNDSIGLEDLQLISLVGKGQFGSVFLCKDKKNVEYALKTIPRGMITHYDLVENLVLERKILLLLDHPMIVKLVKTFKDRNRVCLLMEYVKGLDLFDVLRALNILKEPDSLFYSACLVLILQHIHSLNIIYRDLKPENVMIDSDGYPKLVDFGISRIIKGRTYTIIGTPHYMAPEVITGKGYCMQADYWSLGIMIYEFIYCNVPFAPRDDDPYTVYEKILDRQLIFPEQVSIPAANKLIQQLLSTNPSLRGTIDTIKDNKWFKGMPWENLLDKLLKPPYLPQIRPLKKCETANKGVVSYLDKYDMNSEFRNEHLPDKKWEFEF